jgi:uncharacterized protein with GYD domain
MAKYIVLMNWTDRGIETFKQSPLRYDEGREEAAKLGVEMGDIFWTIGPHDAILTLDAPDDETLAATLLRINSAGNVRTTTLRAFSRDEYARVISRIG